MLTIWPSALRVRREEIAEVGGGREERGGFFPFCLSLFSFTEGLLRRQNKGVGLSCVRADVIATFLTCST